MKNWALVLCLLVPFAAMGQGGGFSGYDELILNDADEASLIDGVPEYITGDVDIELVSDDPSLPPLPIKCGEMHFESANGAISRVRLEGGIDVTHPEGRVRADRALWDFTTNILSFHGNPVIDTEFGKEMAAEAITIDVNTGGITFTGNVNFPGISLTGMKDSAMLTAADVTDWNALLTALKTQANAEAPSPGKHLVSLLDESYQQTIKAVPVATLVQNKPDLVRLLNRLLERPDFYDATAWEGVTLPEDSRAAVANYPPPESALTKVNRSLLEAAFPAAF